MSKGTVIAREAQQELISSIFNKGRLLPCAILIWGPHSSGKSYTLGKVLEAHPVGHLAQVSAREIIYGRRQFLETIVRQLYKSDENLFHVDKINCENLSTFVRELRNIGCIAKIGSERMVLIWEKMNGEWEELYHWRKDIIEEAELLREEHGDIIEVLTHVADMIQFNFCAIFLSSLPLSSYSSLLEMKNILTIRFPQYNKDELIKLITSKPPANCDADNFGICVANTLNVFYMACRDLRKLQRLVLLNYEELIKHDGTLGSSKNVLKVWKKMQPKLAQDFKTLQSNIVPAVDFDQHETQDQLKLSIQKVSYDLCEHSKYLLVAAYLASYNPPTSDKRFFVKSQLAKKRRVVSNVVERKDPQSFTQARFFAIYSALTDSTPEFNAVLMNQITHLCDLKLISLVGNAAGVLDDPKYKCLVSFNYIKEVASSIDIDITNYLFHLVGHG